MTSLRADHVRVNVLQRRQLAAILRVRRATIRPSRVSSRCETETHRHCAPSETPGAGNVPIGPGALPPPEGRTYRHATETPSLSVRSRQTTDRLPLPPVISIEYQPTSLISLAYTPCAPTTSPTTARPGRSLTPAGSWPSPDAASPPPSPKTEIPPPHPRSSGHPSRSGRPRCPTPRKADRLVQVDVPTGQAVPPRPSTFPAIRSPHGGRVAE